MDVRIPLVTNQAPQVESVNAYTDYIEIIFNQYMKIGNESGITVSVNGNNTASYSWQDPEQSPSVEKYSKIVRINTPSGTKIDNTLSIVINNAINYAGISMASSYNTNTKVTHRPTAIELNYEDSITVKNGETKKVAVRVKDENGKYMKGLTVNAVIENTYLAAADTSGVTDNNGTVNLDVDGILPGLTNATFSVSGTTLSKTIDVKVETDPVKTKRPTAVIGGTTIDESAPKENNVTVEKGSTLTLSTVTDGAKIYYVTGESVTCFSCVIPDEYTGPIVINENTKITIVAYKAGLEYSEELIINIAVVSNSGSGSESTTPSNSVSGNSGENNSNSDKPDQTSTVSNNPVTNEPKPGNTTNNSPTNNNPEPNNPSNNEPTPGENNVNTRSVNIPLIITLVVCGIGLFGLIIIIIILLRKKDDEN